MSLLSRLSLRKRFMLYITIWLVVISLIYTYMSLQAIERSTDMVLRERLATAQTIASQLDGLLEHLLVELEGVAEDIAPIIESGEVSEAEVVLDRLFQHWTNFHHITEANSLRLVDLEGQILWIKPTGSDPVRGLAASHNSEILELRHLDTPTIVYPSSEDMSSSSVVFIIVPVSFADRPIAHLVGEIDLFKASHPLAADLDDSSIGYGTELVNLNGEVLASEVADRQGKLSIHYQLFSDQVHARIADVQVHDLPEDDDHGSHIVAYAPLERVPWGIFVEQKKETALRLPRLLKTQLGLFGLLVISAGLITAWLATRSVVGPVNELITAVERIASGDLDAPVPVQRQDEVGQLAVAFERMRQDLAAERRRVQELAILEERDRLAREMHDGFAQALSILNLNSKAVQRAMAVGDTVQAGQILDTLDQVIDQAYADVREAISSLRTTVPQEKGLIAAVNQYLEEFGLQYGLHTELRVDETEGICFSTSQEIQLLRIIQEALSNVRKHAMANQIKVRFAKTNSEVEITIADNGLGFDLSSVEHSRKQAFGLVIMRERVESLKGSFRLETHPGIGTTVIVRIPSEEEGNERYGTNAHPVG